MSLQQPLHPAQTSVLYALRHVDHARYSELLKGTSLESDVFKFHIKKLRSLGLIKKDTEGLYSLTPAGKEYANRLEKESGYIISQPKISMLFIVTCEKDGEVYYLSHNRKRQPFMGYWGLLSAPLLKGQNLNECAKQELKKQTGLDADFKAVNTIRVIDRSESRELLEDKLFIVISTEIDDMLPLEQWHGGRSAWMTRKQLFSQSPLFPMTSTVFELADSNRVYSEIEQVYNIDEY